MWKAIRNCIPRKETTQPIYTRDVKLLANEFNEFFTTVGARTAEAVKSFANENGISQMKFTSFNSFIQRRVHFTCSIHGRNTQNSLFVWVE